MWKSHRNLLEISWKSHGNCMEISFKSHGNLLLVSWHFLRAYLTLSRPIETSSTLSIFIASQSCNFMLVYIKSRRSAMPPFPTKPTFCLVIRLLPTSQLLLPLGRPVPWHLVNLGLPTIKISACFPSLYPKNFCPAARALFFLYRQIRIILTYFHIIKHYLIKYFNILSKTGFFSSLCDIYYT